MQVTTESQTRYQRLVEDAADIIYSTDKEGRFRMWNPVAHELLGYGKDELLGRHYLDLVRADHRESLRRFYGRQWLKSVPLTYRELPVVTRGGDTVWIAQNVRLLFEGGERAGFHCVARDVTRQHRRNSLARLQRSALEMIARNVPLAETLGNICRNVEGIAGDAVCTILVRRGNALYTGAAPSMPPAFSQAVDGLPVSPDLGPCMVAAFHQRTVVIGDIEADASWARFAEFARPLGVRACWSSPIFATEGGVLGTFAMYYRTPRWPSAFDREVIEWCTDLAKIAIERDHAERELRQLHGDLERRVALRTAELADANHCLQREMEEHRRTQQELFEAKKLESVGRLAGGLAHEFNNWLTVIMLYSGQLTEPDGEPVAESINGIRHAAERAASLTRQLLAFGRKQVLKPRVIDFNALIGEMDGMLRGLMGAAVHVRIDRAPGLWPVRVDPAQMEQVIVNLALNARHAMKASGSFTLRTANVTAPSRAIEGTPAAGNWVMIEAVDTGCGMDAETREHVFEPFFTTKAPGEGSGLGLATVYGVIRQSGGEISVSSEPGNGAAFRIFLPRSNRASASEATGVSSTAEKGAGETVLVVDDDAVVRRLVSGVLTRAGYHVIEAKGAKEALHIEQSRNGAIDLLLTDLSMPEVNGRELAEQIKARRPIKVLFMSALSELDDPEVALMRSADSYLPKPFSAATLATKVWQRLHRAH